MSFNDKTLAQVLKNRQTNLSQHLADSFQIAKDHEWVRQDVDLIALSYWLQGVFIGHILLDVTNQVEYDERWSEIAFKALQPFLVVD